VIAKLTISRPLSIKLKNCSVLVKKCRQPLPMVVLEVNVLEKVEAKVSYSHVILPKLIVSF
jgi:hypothetical protein